MKSMRDVFFFFFFLIEDCAGRFRLPGVPLDHGLSRSLSPATPRTRAGRPVPVMVGSYQGINGTTGGRVARGRGACFLRPR